MTSSLIASLHHADDVSEKLDPPVRHNRRVTDMAAHVAGRSEVAPPIERIWGMVQESATAIARTEPLLLPHVTRMVLIQPSLNDALAAMLAHRLASTDVPEPMLVGLIRELFADDAGMGQTVAADFEAVKSRDPACPDYLHVLLNMKGFHALQTHRVAHALWRRDRKPLAFFLANLASRVLSIDIHPAAQIGSGVMFDHGTGIVIGETTVVEDNVSLLQSVTLGGTGKEHGDRHPKVRTGVMVGAGAKILGNIEIGAMSKVAAGSVVLHPVPPYCTVAGVPARVVRRRPGHQFPSHEMDQTV